VLHNQLAECLTYSDKLSSILCIVITVIGKIESTEADFSGGLSIHNGCTCGGGGWLQKKRQREV
jgi:hypothetical protein